MSIRGKIILAIILFGLITGFIWIYQRTTFLDFAKLRFDIKPTIQKQEDTRELPLTDGEDYANNRSLAVDQGRASDYLTSATKDYYHGAYDDALRRLERAKSFDPSNYGVFKLSGQVFFERNELNKAFKNWARASQLPHEDRSMLRDLDVLRRLIRYTRIEIDRLRHSVHRNPDDRISAARLSELERQLLD